MSLGKPNILLVDADLWSYDIAFAAERKTEEGEPYTLPFSYCKDLVDSRIAEIQEKLSCSEYEFYLTGKDNFRHDIATILPYKGNRKQPKPWHYDNLRNYLQFAYNAEVVHGMEADDMLAIRQTELGDSSVIVTRDKDLRMVGGWHYSYAVKNQPEKPLEYIDKHGYLTLKENKKLIGGGLMWFYAQCLMGDRTDNIQGIPKFGDVKAYNQLKDCKTEQDLLSKTREVYNTYYVDEDKARDCFEETAKLVWMVTETLTDGSPKMKEFTI
jgi:5'-3' exonuclease